VRAWVRWAAALITGVLVAPAATGPAPARAAVGAVTVRLAAPSCATSAPSGAAQITAIPWPQERYDPQRLSPLADGAGITVAVIDSGVDARHPQLTRAVLPGRDLLDEDPSDLPGAVDCVSHGTAVASIIAARPVAGVGFQGLAPAARILPIRVSELQVIGDGTSGRAVNAVEFAAAIRYAVGRGADVINLSVVLGRDDPAVRAAVAFALSEDVVVVAAVGNQHDRGDPTPYPAAYEGVLGVGAIGPDGLRVPSSQTGPYVDIVAPGGQVTAAARLRGHGVYEGTSVATPFVAATAALIRQYSPGESAAAVVRRILATADPAPGGRHSNGYGYGVLNPYRAVTERVTGGAPEQPRPLPAGHIDSARVAASARAAENRGRALLFAAAGVAGAFTVLLLAMVVPHGIRRRWRADTR
jgi:type VII secretion-associated serine protease mycosin